MYEVTLKDGTRILSETAPRIKVTDPRGISISLKGSEMPMIFIQCGPTAYVGAPAGPKSLEILKGV